MNKIHLFIILTLTLTLAWAGSSWNLVQTPSAATFNGITSPNGHFAIAVGENGNIVHFNNGDSGTVMPSGTTEELYDVYATSSSFAVAAGEDVVLLWDGVQWDQLFTGSSDTIYTGTWISPEEDVVLYESLGQFNVICPYLPNEPTQPFCRAYSQPMLTACGESNDIKLLMASGNIEHVNNLLQDQSNNLPLHEEAVPLFLNAIWVPPLACLPGSIEPTELFAIRGGDEFWYFDGAEWSNMNVNVPGDQTLTWLSGTNANNILATGFKANGMGGNDGVVWRYDGQNWVEDTNLPAGTPGLSDITAHINLPDLIFANNFDTTNRAIFSNHAQVDILAAAEEGRYLGSVDLFPNANVDLSVSKRLTTPDPIVPGQRITFQLVVQNLGPGTATNVRFLDGYFNSIQIAVDNCGMSEFNVYAGWHYRDVTIPTLAPGEVVFCTMEFDVVGTPGDEIRNYAAVFELDEINHHNNESRITGVMIQSP
ncbi:DUF11 domain-containing protein [Marinicella meishanensis]|uniref:DUF11 domain-containing protein n=1 Tax=Marinicella meishanensis TaxID=2873263 RepID=UPI001CBFE5AE|nr:DUF11 domain-containing protein [Marinicella sp. NBU2979]